MITARTPPATIGFGRLVLISGCRPRRLSPMFVVLWRRHARVRACASASSLRLLRSAEPIGTCLPASLSRTRHHPARFRGARRAKLCRAVTRPPRRFHRATSPEVLSPSARTGRNALSGAASLRTLPLRRCSLSNDPRAGGPSLRLTSPLRFSAVRMQCGAARCAGDLRLEVRKGSALLNRRIVFRSRVRGSTGESDPIALTGDPSHQAPPLGDSLVRVRSCTVAFLWRGVPLPDDRAFAAWLGDGSFPLASPSGAHGVQCPSQVCSRDGWLLISEPPGPHAGWRPYHPPD